LYDESFSHNHFVFLMQNRLQIRVAGFRERDPSLGRINFQQVIPQLGEVTIYNDKTTTDFLAP
jgi:hypothetical protein